MLNINHDIILFASICKDTYMGYYILQFLVLIEVELFTQCWEFLALGYDSVKKA